MKKIKLIAPGILFVLAISFLSMYLGDAISKYIRLETLTIAIVIGILYNNTIKTQVVFAAGAKFSLKNLLKIGIVLLGFKLNIKAILELGPSVVVLVALYVPLVLFVFISLSKVFKINKKLGALIGIGSSICGASAVVALAPCIGADDDDAVVAVSIVSIIGALGVIAYSAIANSAIPISDAQYGIWSGLTLHGVAHALAAAFAREGVSGDLGTFVKMTRVLMLVPVSIAMSYVFKEKDNAKRAAFPMYVLYFVIAGIINSLGIIPESVTSMLTKLSSLLILMAMTAMGLSVNFRQVAKKGAKSFVMGLLLFVILSIAALLIIKIIV